MEMKVCQSCAEHIFIGNVTSAVMNGVNNPRLAPVCPFCRSKFFVIRKQNGSRVSISTRNVLLTAKIAKKEMEQILTGLLQERNELRRALIHGHLVPLGQILGVPVRRN